MFPDWDFFHLLLRERWEVGSVCASWAHPVVRIVLSWVRQGSQLTSQTQHYCSDP